MDKYEYKVRADEIKDLIAQGEYVQAVEIADTIDWRRVKSVMMLCTISDLYKINRRYEDARNMLLLAYERRPGGRTICYSLCELSIKMEDFVPAVNYYKEFVQVAPKDPGRYILQYKLYEAQDVSLEERIGVLEELKKRDYREKWAYELAYLYHRVGLGTRCVEECDELILWFGEGKYVIKALELKMLHQPLSPSQQEKYDHRFETNSQGRYEPQREAVQQKQLYYDASQPGSAPEQPYYDASQPGSVPEQPYYDASQPGSVPGQPYYDTLQPGSAPEQPYYDASQPGSVPGQPYYDASQPGSVPGQPYYDASQPGSVSEQPYYDASQPGSAPEQFYYDTQQPGGIQEQPYYGTPQPGSSQEQFYYNPRQPEALQESSYYAMGQELSSGYEMGGKTKIYETVSREQLTGGGMPAGQEFSMEAPHEIVPDPMEELDIQVKPMDLGQYNTINLQAEIAAGLREVLEEDHKDAKEEITRTIMAPMMETETESLDLPEIDEVDEDDLEPEEEVMEASEVFFGETGEIGDIRGGAQASAGKGSIKEIVPELGARREIVPERIPVHHVVSETALVKETVEVSPLAEDKAFTAGKQQEAGTETAGTAGKQQEAGTETAGIAGKQQEAGTKTAGIVGKQQEAGAETAGTAGQPGGSIGKGEAGTNGEAVSSEPDTTAETVMKQLQSQLLTAQPPRELAGVLSQESDGQLSLVIPESEKLEKQITGQMNLEDILREWERMKQENAEKRKEEVRQHVLQQTGEMFTAFEAAVRDGLLEQLEGDSTSAQEAETAAKRESIADADTVADGSIPRPGKLPEADFAEENEDWDSQPRVRPEAEEKLETILKKAEQEVISGETDATSKQGFHEDAADAFSLAAGKEATEGYVQEAFEGATEGSIRGSEEETTGGFAQEPERGITEAYRQEPEGEVTEAYYQEPEGEVTEAYYQEPEEEVTEVYYQEPEGSVQEPGEGATEDFSQEPDETQVLELDEEPAKPVVKKPKTNKPARTAEQKPQKGSEAAAGKPDMQEEQAEEVGERLSVEREKGKVRSLTKEEKELYGPYIQSRASREQLVQAIDNISMAAYTGNIIITGEEGMDTVSLAKNMIREVQMTDSNFAGKVAKISGQALNKKDVESTVNQLASGALIIQKASGMDSDTVKRLHKALQQDSFGIIIILEDVKKAMNKFLEKYPKLAACFTARMNVEALSNGTLVAFGRKYAREREYSIDDMGILALHTRIDEMQTSDHVVTVLEVKELVDKAIQHANRKNLKHFFDILFARRYDEEDMIILSERDFV